MSTKLAGAWAVVLAALVLALFMVSGSYSSAKSDYKTDLRQAAALTRLYMSAEGRTVSEPSVERKLGNDVRAYAQSHDGQLDGFNANTNSYGGISDAIGEDPFNGVSCSECGPLKQEWEDRLETVASGRADINDLVDQPSEPTNHRGTVGAIGLIWLLTLPAFFVISAIAASRRRNAVLNSYSQEDRQVLAALDRQLESGTADPELSELKFRLAEALRERATRGESEVNQARITHLKDVARDRLDALEAGNRYFEEDR